MSSGLFHAWRLGLLEMQVPRRLELLDTQGLIRSGFPFSPCRAPWRLAVYYFQSRDKRILPLLQAQLHFFERQDQILAGYKLDGTALESFSDIAFQAPVWCLFKVAGAAMCACL